MVMPVYYTYLVNSLQSETIVHFVLFYCLYFTTVQNLTNLVPLKNYYREHHILI